MENQMLKDELQKVLKNVRKFDENGETYVIVKWSDFETIFKEIGKQVKE